MMEPLLSEKKEFALLFPYRREGDAVAFFLQKRDMRAKRVPGMIAAFGGALEEGESHFDALQREIQEELGYEPTHARYFCRYEFGSWVAHAYFEEVAADFEARVSVMEGEYGKFFPSRDLAENAAVTLPIRLIVRNMHEHLLREKAKAGLTKSPAEPEGSEGS